MLRPAALLLRSMIFVHRWMGVVLAIVFAFWFVSGIVMMYWSFPEVSAADRLAHSPVLNPAQIKLTAVEAYAKLEVGGPPDQVHLNTMFGRPVYRFRKGRSDTPVFADNGEQQPEVTHALSDQTASSWTGIPVSLASVEENTEEDQWTVPQSYRQHRPMLKYSYPDGQQVYVSGSTGEVVQYTTTASRFWAWTGAIPHWLYFTQLRKNGPAWTQTVIWSSGIGTVASLIGMLIALWLYSPSRKYRYAGQPARVPYSGQKRWHTIFGLLFGLTCTTWAFSGMMSMDPFPIRSGGAIGSEGRGKGRTTPRIPAALAGGRLNLADFSARSPQDALRLVAGQIPVKELQLVRFAGDPVYLAVDEQQRSRIIPVTGAPLVQFDTDRIKEIVRQAAGNGGLAELSVANEYDLYYLDRTGHKPLPVVVAQLNDANRTRYYIDPKAGRIVGTYGAQGWVNRWLYHGLHSLDFPWLYKYRPLWDVVVLSLMSGGVAICVTSLILSWRVLKRKLT